MNYCKNHNQFFFNCIVSIVHNRLIGYKIFLLFLSLLLLLSAQAKELIIDDKNIPEITYDELPVPVYIGPDYSFSINIIITSTDSLYVNTADLFNNLAIPCSIGKNGNTQSGFIENESNTYFIDFNEKHIKVGDKTFNPPDGLINEMGSIYVESNLLADAFGIIMTFNPRSLYVDLKTNIELPIFKQQRLEETRKNISFLQEKKPTADTVVKRDYHMFKFGMLDWAISSTQSSTRATNNFINMGVGAELFYGEANFSFYYNNQYEFDPHNVNYLWRYVNNDKKIIKQARVGKIPTQTIAFINSPVVGASFTNSPTTVRKASGYYTINDHTEPNWTVELYINDQLIAFTTADASGLYVFKVPIVYGFTTLRLKFYGPQGEERIEERTINLPYTILPANEFEYNLSGGILQDGVSSRFAKAELNYGVNRMLTIGGGMEYLSSISTGSFIPYAKATLQPFSKLSLNAEYAYGVRIKSRLSYYFWKNAVLELDFTRNEEGQRATIFNANEERKANLYVPFKLKRISGYLKADYTQLVYSEFMYHQSNFMLSAYYKQFSANYSVHLNWNNSDNLYVANDFALSLRFGRGYVIRTLTQYNMTDNKLMTLKAEIEKRISKMYVSVSYQRNTITQSNYVNLSFKYDLPFARTSVSAFSNNNDISLSEGAQGSLAFGGDNNYVKAGNNTSVGKGGVMFYPFLDLNQNGVFDNDEHLVLISSVKVSGGRAIISEKDSIVRISDLNAFVDYNFEFNNFDLENIAWQFKYKTYQVLIDPNQFKRVDVPIIAMGEANGMVYLNTEDGLKGIGRIVINFYDKQGNKVAETLTESDGYLNYLGLKPGDYLACLDSTQLNGLNLTVKPLCREFHIKTTVDGDMVSRLDFVLNKELDKDTLIKSSVNTPTNKTENMKMEKPTEQDSISSNINTSDGQIYSVQLLAIRKPVDVKAYFAKLTASFPYIVIKETKGEDGYFRYSVGVFSSKEEALNAMNKILDSGWKDCFISKKQK